MPTHVIATKLFVPPPRPNAVPRPQLIARLNAGLHRKLTLISAPAGFGKTSLASTWIAGCGRPAALPSPKPSHFSRTDDHHEPGRYEIRLKGHLDDQWAARFADMSFTHTSDGTTILAGPVVDQATLHGLLRSVRDL